MCHSSHGPLVKMDMFIGQSEQSNQFGQFKNHEL
jgi:hypothetical protein